MLKKIASLLSLLFCLFSLGLSSSNCRGEHTTSKPSTSETHIKESAEVCFTPDKDCTFQIDQEINQAKTTVLMQAFSFTSGAIAKALVAAKNRGVRVEVILDRDNYLKEFTQTQVLTDAAIPVYLDGNHQTAHNKVIVVDGKTVITGSFNFTKAAQEKNAENVLILRDPNLAQAYQKNWENHREHSERVSSK